MNIEKPHHRKGYVITAVQWGSDGKVLRTRYDRIGPAPAAVSTPATTPPPVRRSILAIEQGRLL